LGPLRERGKGEGNGRRGGEGKREGRGERRGREGVHNLGKTTPPPVIRWLVTGVA